jgi:hypothetical protein
MVGLCDKTAKRNKPPGAFSAVTGLLAPASGEKAALGSGVWTVAYRACRILHHGEIFQEPFTAPFGF